ncbi:MAG: outer membrane beta-barrel family protein [Candidatus Marinimicrobia bacterium]|nr:outer membrane beta-barrel family protein [Candidatus Neomarinimicrobiota bacterium]
MRKLLLLTFLMFTSVGFAQHGGRRGGMSQRQMDPTKVPKIGVVYGTVVDSASNTPIAYASVAIINNRSNTIMTGGITNEDGEFHIKEIALGRHKVVIEYIGYKKVELGPYTFMPFGGNQTEYNLETISLTQTTLQMAGIDVEGERPLFVQTAEKRVFNVEKNSLATGGNAIDALRQVPGVEVDPDDNISLRGSSRVNLMIDGKPSSIAGGDIKSLLQSVPAANIADIEVMTNPGAKYDPEGMAGIINIVLKENKFAGLNGNVNTGGDSQGGTNLSGQVNYRTITFNSFINLGMNDRKRISDGDSYRWMDFPAFRNELNQTTDSKSGGPNLFVKTGFEYFIDPTQSLAISTTISNGNRNNDSDTYTVDTGPGEKKYYRTSTGDGDRNGYDINLNYDKKFTNPKQKLTSYIRFSDGLNDGLNEYYNTDDGGVDFVDLDKAKNGQDGTSNGFDFKLDYSHPFNDNSKLEVGLASKATDRGDIQVSEVFDQTSNQYIADRTFSNEFVYNEAVHAAYIQYGGALGFIGYNVGGRYETVNMMSELKTTNESFDNDYKSFYPSLSVTFGAPQLLQIQTSYSKRVRRPRSRMLNPFSSRQDTKNIRKGNPFLKPEYTDSYELNFSRYSKGISLTLGGYYRYTTDRMQRHKEIRPDGVSVATYENIGTQKTKGLEYNAVGSLGQKLRLILSGSYYWDELNSDLYGTDYNKTVQNQRMRVTTIWNISPTTEFMFFMFYMPPRDIPIGKMDAMTWSSMSIKKKLMDERLNLTLNVNDPFGLSGMGFETWGDIDEDGTRDWYQEANRNWSSQTLRLTLEYRFGKMEDRSRFSRQRGEGMEMEEGSGEIF